MKYRCQMCKNWEQGADTREGFVLHMRSFHGVTITAEEIMDLEGLTPWSKRREERRQRMREVWARRRLICPDNRVVDASAGSGNSEAAAAERA
jgi:hypothetical protein